jgi:cysteinyl-tRNA synthetase
MITIAGKKMGKSYNNQIKLTEMFSGDHHLLSQPFSPMTIRFFILQTHYRSTLDFSSEALVAAEKGLKRLWEAYDILQQWSAEGDAEATDAATDAKCTTLISAFDEYMNDDFSTAKILANMFELVPVINSIKDGHIAIDAIAPATIRLMQQRFKTYIEDIFGLLREQAADDSKLAGVMQLLIDIRKEARTRKDFATSDKIRNQLGELGIQLKDEKDGSVHWTTA